MDFFALFISCQFSNMQLFSYGSLFNRFKSRACPNYDQRNDQKLYDYDGRTRNGMHRTENTDSVQQISWIFDL